MTTKTVGARVVSLQSHRARRSATRSRELAEAMRRHPSYQAGSRHAAPAEQADAVVVSIGPR